MQFAFASLTTLKLQIHTRWSDEIRVYFSPLLLRKASVMEEHGRVLFIQNFLAMTDLEANWIKAEGCTTADEAWKWIGWERGRQNGGEI